VVRIGLEEARQIAALGHSVYHISKDTYRHDSTMRPQCTITGGIIDPVHPKEEAGK
jgi:hypothetical protein